MGEWFENGKFWETFFPYMFPESRLLSGAKEVKAVMRLTGKRRGGVLDLCCGPGRHSAAFAKRKRFRVTGVDRTPFNLSRARRYARKKGVKVEWVRCDMREFVRPGAFDLAVNLFTSFGYFEDAADDLKVAENLFTSLKPRGKFVVELMGKEVLARIFTPSNVDECEDGSLLVQRRWIDPGWDMIDNEWILVKNGRARSFRVRHRLYSGMEMKALLEKAGFTRVRLYGGLDGSPYDRKANRLVAVAAKT